MGVIYFDSAKEASGAPGHRAPVRRMNRDIHRKGKGTEGLAAPERREEQRPKEVEGGCKGWPGPWAGLGWAGEEGRSRSGWSGGRSSGGVDTQRRELSAGCLLPPADVVSYFGAYNPELREILQSRATLFPSLSLSPGSPPRPRRPPRVRPAPPTPTYSPFSFWTARDLGGDSGFFFSARFLFWAVCSSLFYGLEFH